MRTDSEQDLQMGKWLASAAVGALVMYMLDPERGASRRAESVDKLRALGHQTGQALDSAMQKVRPGATATEPSTPLDTQQSSPQQSSQPGESAGVSAQSTGLGSLLDGPATGIKAIARGLRERSWDPQVRTAALWGGGALGLFSLATRRMPLGLIAGLAGAVLLARRASGRPMVNMAGTAGKPVTIEKTLRIDVSPEQVYDLWANYENFPRFMNNVLEVRDLGGIRSHWVVKGPAGTRFEFDSILTERNRPERLAWQSAPGAEIEQYGEVRIEEVRGGSRATVRLSYRPPAGAAGETFAELVGRDPQRQLDEDLQRMKSLLERGSIPDAAAQGRPSDSRFLH